MCRLWAISYGPDGPNAEAVKPTALARRMTIHLAPGNRDAFGWAWLTRGGAVRAQKRAGDGSAPDAWREISITGKPRWVMGHVRKATAGTPERHVNNHPIRHRGLLGVHNGVLRNADEILAVTGRADKRAEVDSEAIFAAIRAWGIDEGLRAVSGTMAALWVDVKADPEALWFARGHGRPLAFGRTRAGSTLVASTTAALRASGLDLVRVVPVGLEDVRGRLRRGTASAIRVYNDRRARLEVVA